MSDTVEGYTLPSEFDQVRNYISTISEISEAGIQHSLLETILAGLSTIIPQVVLQSRILQRRDLLNVTEWMLRCQVALNDHLDLSHADNPNGEYEERLRLAIDQFNFSTRLLEDQGQAF